MSAYPLELLAPAKDLACGLAAVNHGADAVYIGAPRFGARAAAGNSLQDIEELVHYAHLYGARVYIALNTLLDDRELDEAVPLVHSLYQLGADGLIIQDMGLLECDLPPIPLHASTQTNNRTVDKVRFLEQVGFDQVVLARELSIDEIRAIRQATTVPLECFIHGALCVSYSGQCYISEVVSGRSANRGECAQFCRHRYTLRDGKGQVVARDRYLLSLKDLDLSAHLAELIDAGISSFKIEGRLKDISYVKNITAYYRQLLDRLLDGDSRLQRSSSGQCHFSFVPDPAKSFNRGRTTYFYHGPGAACGQPDTSKSLGEVIGPVLRSGKGLFVVDTKATLHNGDGLCFFQQDGTLTGLKANRVEGRTVHHRERQSPPAGTIIHRNHDVAFTKMLAASEQCRTLTIDLVVEETDTGLACAISDEDGITSRTELACDREVANQPGTSKGVIERQMRKSGGTLFTVGAVEVTVSDTLFVRAATVNELRRLAFIAHTAARLDGYRRRERNVTPTSTPWASPRVTCLDNISNSRAEAFYRRHGVSEFAYAATGAPDEPELPLMTTRYCVKAQLGLCPKAGGGKTQPYVEPFILSDNTGDYLLECDCRHCQMTLRRSRK